MITITLYPYHLLVPFGLFFIVFLLVYFWITVENVLFNNRMKRMWEVQKYKYADLHTCPKCEYPQYPAGRIMYEGFPILILRKYYWETFMCRNCKKTFDYIIRWNGLNGGQR